jgi:heat shock protein HslJ
VEGNTLSFGEVVSTLMACEDESVMAQEKQYYNALETAGTVAVTDGQLTITYDDGRGVLNFAEAPAG